MGQVMELWPGREKGRLVDALRSKMRLLLPEDPGRERMVELVQLFDPDARPASAGRICVDVQRRIYLPRPTAIDPGTAAEAQAPPGFPVAYFVQLRGRSAPLDMSGAQRESRELHQTAVLLVNGLAIRLGGSPGRRLRSPASRCRLLSTRRDRSPRPTSSAWSASTSASWYPVRTPG